MDIFPLQRRHFLIVHFIHISFHLCHQLYVINYIYDMILLVVLVQSGVSMLYLHICTCSISLPFVLLLRPSSVHVSRAQLRVVFPTTLSSRAWRWLADETNNV